MGGITHVSLWIPLVNKSLFEFHVFWYIKENKHQSFGSTSSVPLSYRYKVQVKRTVLHGNLRD